MLDENKTLSHFSAIEILDIFLKILNTSDELMIGISLQDIRSNLSDKEKLTLANNEALLILERLIDDKYAIKVFRDNEDAYRLTFNGRFFHQNGGYNQKDISDKLNEKYKMEMERWMGRSSSIAAWGAVIAAIAGILLLLHPMYMAIQPFFQWLSSCYCK